MFILSHFVLSSVDYYMDNGTLNIRGSGSTSKEAIQQVCPDLDYEKVIIDEGVELIDKETFSFSMSLTTADIKYVKNIGERAFASCNRLVSVTFGEGLKEIQSSAFERASSLESITFPSTLTTIGSMAFANVNKITEVSIPLSTWTIGSGAFAGCKSLTKFIVANKHQRFHDGADGALYNVERTTLIAYPAGVEKETPSFESSCTTIGAYGISGNRHITYVELPSKISRLNEEAFRGCSSLEKVTVEVTTIPTKCFSECSKLKEVTLKEGLEVIEGHAFDGCIGLKSIQFPDSLEEIGEHAFENVPISSAVGKNVKIIGDYAFSRSARLAKVSFPSIVTICDHSFDSSKEIDSVELGNSLTTIGSFAFADTPKLKKVELGKSALQTIGASAFHMSGIESAEIPVNVSVIPPYCFRFSKLKNITVSGIIKEVEASAFKNCDELQSVTFLNNVEKFSEDAFIDVSPDAVLKYCGTIAVNGSATKGKFKEVLVGSYYPKDTSFAGETPKVTDKCELPPVPTPEGKPGNNNNTLTWILIGVGVCVVLLAIIAAALWCKRYKARKDAITEGLMLNRF